MDNKALCMTEPLSVGMWQRDSCHQALKTTGMIYLLQKKIIIIPVIPWVSYVQLINCVQSDHCFQKLHGCRRVAEGLVGTLCFKEKQHKLQNKIRESHNTVHVCCDSLTFSRHLRCLFFEVNGCTVEGTRKKTLWFLDGRERNWYPIPNRLPATTCWPCSHSHSVWRAASWWLPTHLL